MRRSPIPADNVRAAHEQAAKEIGELRRKGVPCHLEEHADSKGHRIEVVCDPPGNPMGWDRERRESPPAARDET